MLWFLVLHMAALLFWAATLLYLPALVAGTASQSTAITERPRYGSISRFTFTHVATPAALVAIASGTVVFLLNHTVEVWLIAKLTLVTGLVVCHALTGLLVLRSENAPDKPLRRWCVLLGLVMAVLVAAIIWVVLWKPAWELNL
ncbi:MAG: CopD family protein [Ectothiorhodospiraceae bacterium]|nr:CopD family protein [Ectothiorhodospiraceae bacterium]MCH8503925.1 CopD family protein [Ectothiorhodospiraceae bacterium]